MNGIQAYQKSSVQTSPSRLLIMLFDGLLKFCKYGQQMMEKKELEQANHFIIRAQDIIVELMTTLNRKYSPELCDQLYGLYDFMYRHLVEANTNKDPKRINDVIKLATQLRETFYEASLKVAQNPKIK